jgi:hypothetical protein
MERGTEEEDEAEQSLVQAEATVLSKPPLHGHILMFI